MPPNSGRFVLDQWLQDGKLFSSYYAFSPSLEDGYIVDKVGKAPDNSLTGKAPLIITIANEGEHMQEPFTQLVAMLEKTSASTFSHKKFPEESHRTTKHPSLQFALRTTFAGWVPDYETKTGGLEGLKKHYQDLSNKFGFKVAIPTDMLQRLTAYYATGQGDEPQAQLNIMVKYILVDAGQSPDVLFEVTDYLINNEYEEAGKQLIAAICDVNNSPKRCTP